MIVDTCHGPFLQEAWRARAVIVPVACSTFSITLVSRVEFGLAGVWHLDLGHVLLVCTDFLVTFVYRLSGNEINRGV